MRNKKLFLIAYYIIIRFVSPSCIPSATQCGCSQQAPLISQSRIVGGFTARNHSWPWTVSLRRVSNFELPTSPGSALCGGTLLDDQHVLTAAHCFYNINPSFIYSYFVVVGAQYISDTNPLRFNIESVTLHENYTDGTYLNDIAIVKLTYPVNFSDPTIGFICLPPRENVSYPVEQTVAIAVGWGLLNETGSASFALQQVELPIIADSNKVCADQANDYRVQFCAGYFQGGKDTCQGDSGGPLMVLDANSNTWNIAGITSYGHGCGESGYPGVYTRVSMFTDWINAQVNSAPKFLISNSLTMTLYIVVCIVFYS